MMLKAQFRKPRKTAASRSLSSGVAQEYGALSYAAAIEDRAVGFSRFPQRLDDDCTCIRALDA